LFISTDTATTEIYTLSLHDALPISLRYGIPACARTPRIAAFGPPPLTLLKKTKRLGVVGATSTQSRAISPTMVSSAPPAQGASRSEEHTSELQSRGHLVCRLLLEKK